MTQGAFHGDAAIKAALLARIDDHITAGTLVLDGPVWEDGRGSPLGIAIEGDDPATYAQAYGYPLPLAAALDPLALFPAPGFDGLCFARNWVAAVAPGADLGGIPARLLMEMLSSPELQDWKDAITAQIADCHRRALDGTPPSRDEWAALRALIVQTAATAITPRRKAVAACWEAACWPAEKGRSILVGTIAAWRGLAPFEHHDDWDDGLEEEAMTMLDAIMQEQRDRPGEGHPAYHELFRDRDAALCQGYGANLIRANRRYFERGAAIAQRCIALFHEASVPSVVT